MENQWETERTEDGLLVTVFTLGDTFLGIDARLVEEVVRVGELTPVPGAPAAVVGIRNLRGRIVTVLDMAEHLELVSTEQGDLSRLLIMDDQGESLGFLVDSVEDALALDPARLGKVPAGMDPVLKRVLSGVWRDDERLIALLDRDSLFRWESE